MEGPFRNVNIFSFILHLIRVCLQYFYRKELTIIFSVVYSVTTCELEKKLYFFYLGVAFGILLIKFTPTDYVIQVLYIPTHFRLLFVLHCCTISEFLRLTSCVFCRCFFTRWLAISEWKHLEGLCLPRTLGFPRCNVPFVIPSTESSPCCDTRIAPDLLVMLLSISESLCVHVCLWFTVCHCI